MNIDASQKINLSIAFVALFIAFIANALFYQHQLGKNLNARNDLGNSYRIFESIKDNEDVQVLVSKYCLKEEFSEKCEQIAATVDLRQVKLLRDSIDEIVGNEKGLVTQALAVKLSQLTVAFEGIKYGQNLRREGIEKLYSDIQSLYFELIEVNNLHLEKSSLNFHIVNFILLIGFVSYLSWLILKIIRHEKEVEDDLVGYKNDLVALTGILAKNESLLEGDHKDKVSENSNIILNKIVSLQSAIEEKENSIQLFNLVNKSINYEFRNITNTLTGGVKLLSSEVEGQHVVLANEVVQSALILEELADNFWNLFAESNEENILSTSKFLDKLLGLFRRRAEKNHQNVECMVTRYVPRTIYLSEVKLLWGVYLEAMRLMDLYRGKSLFLVIDAETTVRIDRTRLSFNLYFLESLDLPSSDIIDRGWEIEDENQSYFLRLIFKDYVYPALSYYHHEGNILVKLQLDVQPESNFKHEELLSGYHLLVCGSNALQIDILEKTLHIYGAEVDILKSPTEVFQKMTKDKDFEGIILTDTLSGVDFYSFLKTLGARSKKINPSSKLILSVSDKRLESEATDNVDKIVFRPSSAEYLVNNVLEVLEDKESSEDENIASIVVVDDDDAHGFILSEILMEAGWDVEVFDNAFDGIDYIFEHDTKMAFIDCIMPEISGFDAAKRIRQKEKELKRPAMTIFAATGLTSVSEMNQCIASGMDYVIYKPYNQNEIIKVMKTYMAAKKVN